MNRAGIVDHARIPGPNGRLGHLPVIGLGFTSAMRRRRLLPDRKQPRTDFKIAYGASLLI